MAFEESAFEPLELSEASHSRLPFPTFGLSRADFHFQRLACRAGASVADEELDDDDELVLLLSLSNSFSARKAFSLRFFLAAGRHAMVLQRFRVTWKGNAGRRELELTRR